MKKILVVALAMMTTAAFAQKSMVRFSNVGNHNGAKDVNFSHTNSEYETPTQKKSSEFDFAFNYAYTVAPQIQVGLGVHHNHDSSNDYTTWTLSGYYNLSSNLTNTYYAGLHFATTNIASDKNGSVNGTALSHKDKHTATALEFGRRFAIGSWAGYNLTFAPNVTYTMTKIDWDAAGRKDTKENSLTWNFLKFDVLF